jgi:hypothetical protein
MSLQSNFAGINISQFSDGNLNVQVSPEQFTFTNSGGWIFLGATIVVLLFVILSIMNAYQYFRISENSDKVDFIDKGQSQAYAIINCILGAIFVFFAAYLIYKTVTVKSAAIADAKLLIEDLREAVSKKNEQLRLQADQLAFQEAQNAQLVATDKEIDDIYQREKNEDRINTLGTDIYTLERERDTLQQLLIRNENNLKTIEQSLLASGSDKIENELERETLTDQSRELKIIVEQQKNSLKQKRQDIDNKKFEINQIKYGAQQAKIEQDARLALQKKYNVKNIEFAQSSETNEGKITETKNNDGGNKPNPSQPETITIPTTGDPNVDAFFRNAETIAKSGGSFSKEEFGKQLAKLSDARKKNITDNVKNQKPENIYSIQKIRSEIEKFITDPEIQKGYAKNRNTELNNKYTALIQNLEQAQQQASTSTTAPASNTGATTTDNTAPVSNTGATTTDNTAPASTTAPVSNTGRGKTPGNRGGGRSKTPGNKSRKK